MKNKNGSSIEEKDNRPLWHRFFNAWNWVYSVLVGKKDKILITNVTFLIKMVTERIPVAYLECIAAESLQSPVAASSVPSIYTQLPNLISLT